MDNIIRKNKSPPDLRKIALSMAQRRCLGDAELEIMLILWASPEPQTTTQIHQQLSTRRNWAKPGPANL